MNAVDPAVRFIAKNMRLDLRLIAEMILPDTRVLDIGSGDGTLIDHLYRTRGCDARGIELDMAEVTRSVAHGLPVMHGDADHDLAQYPDGAFDYVVLSRTLQAVERPREVLRQMLRIGKHAIVSFPNFGHWQVRLAAAVARPDADDLGLGAAVARDAEHPSLHDSRLFRALRGRRLPYRALARDRRRGPELAVAAQSRARQRVRRAGAIPVAQGGVNAPGVAVKSGFQ